MLRGLILPSMTRVRIPSIRFRITSTEMDTRMEWILSPKGCKLWVLLSRYLSSYDPWVFLEQPKADLTVILLVGRGRLR